MKTTNRSAKKNLIQNLKNAANTWKVVKRAMDANMIPLMKKKMDLIVMVISEMEDDEPNKKSIFIVELKNLLATFISGLVFNTNKIFK